MSQPAQIDFRAPDRLVKFLAKEGFDVSLSIVRAKAMMVDPGAYPMDPSDPFDDNDRDSIEGIISAYDATEGPLDESAE